MELQRRGKLSVSYNECKYSYTTIHEQPNANRFSRFLFLSVEGILELPVFGPDRDRQKGKK